MPADPASLAHSDSRPVAAIFRSPIFNASETFVQAHALALRRFQPLIVGLERTGAADPALESHILLPRTAAERSMIRLTGSAAPLADRVAAWRPKLVHAHFGTDGLIALPLARRLGVPLVTTLHGYDVMRTRGALLRSMRLSWMRYAVLRQRLIDGGDLFLAVSDAIRQRAIAQGFRPESLVTHYLGVDLAAFDPGDGARDSCLVLHVGRLVEKKGTALLLEAFARVRDRVPGARLAVIGDGPLRRSLEAKCAALGLGASVDWLGALPHTQVRAWLRRAALAAVPSVTARDGDAEGLPTVIFEASASGVPVVGSDHSGIPEAVVEGETGFVVPEGDAEALAARIATLLADPARARAMGTAARALAEREFDARRQADKLEARYDELIACA